MDYKTEKIHQIAFTQIKGIGPHVLRLIMREFNDITEIYELSESDLKSFISKDSIRESILNKEHFKRAEQEFDYCEKHGIEILFFKDKKYPNRLNYFESSPSLLYYKGNCDLNSLKIVSIVGTRDPSNHGKIKCEKIVEELVSHQVVVVSGLAFGIDVIAHKSAIKFGLPTIGVTAHGLDTIYPSSNSDVGKAMLENGGLLTEYMTKTEIIRELFPTRNRIVAAMCDALIVVESARKGGSLITAEYGNEFGKDVFAVPGRPEDDASRGCNLLIKSHKAHMYESVKDLEYILRWDKEKKTVQGKLFEDLSEEENKVVNFIRHQGESHIDSISGHLNKSSAHLAATILNLELKGILKSLPGKRYICIY